MELSDWFSPEHYPLLRTAGALGDQAGDGGRRTPEPEDAAAATTSREGTL